MSIWILGMLVVGPLESENLVKVLRYQYEQELKALRIENAKLQQEVHELKKQEIAECAVSPDDKPISEAKKTPAKSPKIKAEDDLSLYQSALSEFELERWNEAILYLERLVKDFPGSQYADNSIYLMAQIYSFKGQWELARIELLRLLENYPKSERSLSAKADLEKIESFQSPKDQ